MKFNIIETKNWGDRQKEPPHKNAVAIPDDDLIECTLYGNLWEIEINTLDELLQLLDGLDDTDEIVISTFDNRRTHKYTIEIYNGFRE